MKTTPHHYIHDVITLAFAAGDAIMEHYGADSLDTQTKTDSKGMESPVTVADLAAHDIIASGLKEIDTSIPIVSEEQDSKTNMTASQSELYWLVDPLDGTKSFIKKDGQFTVNIALIQDKQPVMGVVYAPAIETIYFTDENGSYRSIKGETKQIFVSENTTVSNAVASKDHLDETTKEFLDQFGEINLLQAGSSLKICRVAEGSADIYPRLLPTTMEWDTAAADAILRASGGEMLDTLGKPLAYGKPPELRNQGFVAKNQLISIDLVEPNL